MNSSLSVKNLVLFAAAALTATVATLFIGCSQKPDVSNTQYTAQDMQAHKLPYTKAYINYGGSLAETNVSAVNRSGEVDFLFMVDGTLHERESYKYDDESFRFAGDAGDKYSPGITLLKFPFNAGDEWTWSGAYRIGDQEDKSASAKITTSSERLATLAGEYDTVMVVVDLEIESGSINPVHKELKFWFVPGTGLIRREIEHSTSREPMQPRPDSEE